MKLVNLLIVSSFMLLFSGLMSARAADNMSADKKKVVQSAANKALQKAQNKVIDEAARGISLTYKALSEIRNGNIEEAKTNLIDAAKAFDKSTAKKEDFTPASVSMDIQIGVETPQEAANLMDLAEEAITASHPQVARDLLNPLVSEIDITETDIPIYAYKDLVNKAIVSLDEKNNAKAQDYLLEAFGSAVFVSEVIPVPTLFAEADLDEASKIVSKDPKKALKLLNAADDQIMLSNILGYEQTKPFSQRYKTVRKKIISAHHADVWSSIRMKLGLIKKNVAQSINKVDVAKVNEAVNKIEQKSNQGVK